MYLKELVKEIRLLPMGKSIFSTREEVEEFFSYTLIKRGGKYLYKTHTMNCDDNTLVLFQYEGVLIASALLISQGKLKKPQDDYTGYYMFDVSTITIFNKDITLRQIQKIEPNIRAFGMGAQEINLDKLSKVLSLIKLVSDTNTNIIQNFNKERFIGFLEGFKLYIETKSGKRLTNLSDNMYFVEQEGYKSEIFLKAQSILCVDKWQVSDIGTGGIAIRAMKAVDECGNLVHHQQKLHFKNKVESKTKLAEQILYNIYCGTNDRKAFDDAVEFFGGKYDLMATLFFIKDSTKYLPIRSSIFDDRFEFFDIPFSSYGKCNSENYFKFIEIINKLRVIAEGFYGFEISLLDAHSIIWQLEIANDFVKSLSDTAEDDKLINQINCVNVEDDDGFEYSDEPKEKGVPIYRNGHKSYPRDKQTAINALNHAGYRCEINAEHESFISRNSGKKYMEPHHLIPMAFSDYFDVSLDVEENIVSLCSNCHNEIHYGKNARIMIEKLYNQRKELLKNKKLEVTLEELFEMYGV